MHASISKFRLNNHLRDANPSYKQLHFFVVGGARQPMHTCSSMPSYSASCKVLSAAAAEGVYIWGGSGGQKDNYIHTHTRLHILGYAIKAMEM